MKRIASALLVLLCAGVVAAETITVVTVNAWSGLTYTGAFASGEYEDAATRRFRFDLLTAGLGQLRPDVIAIQEANPLPGFADRVAEALTYDAVSAVRQAGVRIGTVGLPVNLREGSVILADRSRGLSMVGTTQLSGPGAGRVASFQLGSGANLIASEITVEGRRVYVLTTRWTPSPHADAERLRALVDAYDRGELSGDEYTALVRAAVEGSERRLREARATLTYINELAGTQPVILMGSFFALPGSPEIQLLRDAGFTDVWAAVNRTPGYTFDARTNSTIIEHSLSAPGSERERYDYIFIRGDGIVARSASIVFDRPTFGVHPSAHFGIRAELRVDPVR